MDNHNRSRVVISRHKKERANVISLKKERKKETGQKGDSLTEKAANLKSAQRSLEEAFNTHLTLLFLSEQALSIALAEEVRVANALFTAFMLAASSRQSSGRNPGYQGMWAGAALTYRFCCLLEFWVPSPWNIRARQPPLLSTISETGRQRDWCGEEGSPEGRGRGSYSPSTQSWHRL